MTTLVNPATGEAAFELQETEPEAAAAAVAGLREAQGAWEAAGGLARAARLVEAAERVAGDAEMAGLIVTDVGKPIAEARAEVARTAAILRYVASLATSPVGDLYEDAAGGQVRVVRRARGFAVLITPWNFPAAIPAWKLAPALQAGNSVALKPASQATRVAERLVGHLQAAGIDAIALVPGGRRTAEALLDARPDAVSFTGSTATGRSIAERLAGRFVPLQLEMGGKNGVYVSSRADPAEAARIALAGAMGYAGQKCTATSLLLVDEEAVEAVKGELVRQTDALGVGDPHDPATVVGPLIDAGKRDDVARRLADARDRGVAVARGGEPLDGPGAFLAPTLLEGAAPDDPVNREELFAPVLSLQAVEGLDEALHRLETLPYGLVAGIVSPIRSEVEAFARRADAGIVRVNAPTTGVEPHVPFGGVKDSSFGPREQGRAGLEFFSETRTIYG